ncbi:ABC transporter ATP-binding protein [Fundicoccus sp. Sow4_H7]|uniref:ABC transporter ATP-binding protein n=1 Tax=Fundicoccus sp. Sow4_H7 TaxID=3438784 RepID=UPI003F8DA00F
MRNRALFIRAFKDLWRVGKTYYSLTFLQYLATASQTFMSFIFMNRLITLMSQQEMISAFNLIVIYLVVFAILQLISTLIRPLVNNAQELTQRRIQELPFEKMLTLQYHLADSAETKLSLERIRIGNLSRQSSLNLMNVRIPYLIDYFIRIIWSIILLIPMFTQTNHTVAEPFVWLTSPWVSLIFVVGIILSIYIQSLSSGKASAFMENIDESIIRTNTMFNYERDILANAESGKEIRLYKLQDKIFQNQLALDKSTGELIVTLTHIGISGHLLTTVVNQVLQYFAYAIIGIRVMLGLLPIGQIVQLSSAMTQLLVNLPNFIQYLVMMLSQPDVLEEYYAFMDLPDEKEVGSLPIEKRLDNKYHLSVENLSFAYPGTETNVLDDISVDFEVGKKYALVGENGSGKSTFIKLLMRLYDPSAGQITLNEINAQKYRLTEYFKLFSVVFQDFRLLSLTLGQNIAVNQSYDAERAMEHIEELDLKQMVDHLPKQLDTYLSKEFESDGVNLSGGQEQRVALARALYKDAPIMILDEPTAALDPVTEFKIYQQFDELINHKTAFYISHRLSSCRFCDEILVFDQGKIIQRGSHEELVAVEGKYADLWNAQAQYYQ